jgi:hypothetical protein
MRTILKTRLQPVKGCLFCKHGTQISTHSEILTHCEYKIESHHYGTCIFYEDDPDPKKLEIFNFYNHHEKDIYGQEIIYEDEISPEEFAQIQKEDLKKELGNKARLDIERQEQAKIEIKKTKAYLDEIKQIMNEITEPLVLRDKLEEIHEKYYPEEDDSDF